jgi:hypothetical protein
MCCRLTPFKGGFQTISPKKSRWQHSEVVSMGSFFAFGVLGSDFANSGLALFTGHVVRKKYLQMWAPNWVTRMGDFSPLG